jgi:hypothetical protein
MRSSLPFLFLLVPGLLGPVQAQAQPPGPPDLQNLVEESRFIFQGTVRKLGAANMAAVPASPANAVVTVDQVITAPEQLGDFTGREITVALLRPDSLKPGQQAVFFTYGWIYGQTLAVREVGHLDARQNLGALREQIADARRRNDEQGLADRLARAELVVVGRLVRIAPVRREETHLPITEHDPDLRRAVVQVETVLKGQAPPNHLVSFLFANSRDVLWDRSPKPKVYQEAVWILSRNEKKGLQLEALTAFDRRDIQPRDRQELLGRLLKNQR